MSDLYRFSPITTKQKLDQAYEYIASELERLSQQLFNQSLPITTLKVFPHYLEEAEYLHEQVSKMGAPAPFNSKTSFYAEVDTKIGGHDIKYLGTRIVDPYRLHVGCGDYEVEDLSSFKKEHVGTSPFVREFSGNDEMVELWHPDFDVLGYVVEPYKT